MIVYVVILEDDITSEMIEVSLNTDTSYRKSLDGSKGILKYGVIHPDCCAGYHKHTHAEILQYLVDNAVDW